MPAIGGYDLVNFFSQVVTLSLYQKGKVIHSVNNQQVIAVRVDARARKIYGCGQEMIEAAPYMFAPL